MSQHEAGRNGIATVPEGTRVAERSRLLTTVDRAFADLVDAALDNDKLSGLYSAIASLDDGDPVPLLELLAAFAAGSGAIDRFYSVIGVLDELADSID